MFGSFQWKIRIDKIGYVALAGALPGASGGKSYYVTADLKAGVKKTQIKVSASSSAVRSITLELLGGDLVMGTVVLTVLQFFTDAVYSLPTGVLCQRVGGKELSTTASTMITGVGVSAGVLSATLAGALSDAPGGFGILFILIIVATALCLVLLIIIGVVDLRSGDKPSYELLNF